ncbi:hypothetical protein WDW37_02640 [Bdellovibrionota bacterium FG-1]
MGAIQTVYGVTKDPTTGKERAEGALSFETVSVLYERGSNRPLGVEVNAAVLEYLKIHGQVAFKINDVNFDLCAGAKGTIKLGEITMMGRSNGASLGLGAEACAGIQIGKAFNIRDHASVSLDTVQYSHMEDVKDSKTGEVTGHNQKDDPSSNFVQVHNSVRLDKIAGSPVGVCWDHDYDVAQSGGQDSQQKSVTTNIFGVGAAF